MPTITGENFARATFIGRQEGGQGETPLELKNRTPLPLEGQKFGNKNEEFIAYPSKFLQIFETLM